MSCYTQHTQGDQYQIYILKKAGHHQAEIAATLKDTLPWSSVNSSAIKA